MIGLVTDSNSQIPAELADGFGVQVVAVSVVIDGVEYLEGVDIDADDFYTHFADGQAPVVTTSQPSPGAFAETYRRMAEAGADEIVSIHVTEALSGTLNSARLAADTVTAAVVHLVDSGTASFGVACCVWEAGLARDAGAAAAEVVAVAEATAAKLHSITAVGVADLLNRSGRVDFQASAQGVELITTRPSPDDPAAGISSLGVVHSADEACDAMASAMAADGAPIRVALGIADATAAPFYEGLEARLASRPDVADIVRYRIGPSVGAFTGPGTAGGFWWQI